MQDCDPKHIYRNLLLPSVSSNGSLAEDDDEQLSLLIYMQKVPVGLLVVDISAQQVVFFSVFWGKSANKHWGSVELQNSDFKVSTFHVCEIMSLQ